MRELWEETPCEHGRMQPHWVTVKRGGWGEDECLGGSRRRVTPPADMFDPVLAWVEESSFVNVFDDGEVRIDGSGWLVDAALVAEEGTTR